LRGRHATHTASATNDIIANAMTQLCGALPTAAIAAVTGGVAALVMISPVNSGSEHVRDFGDVRRYSRRTLTASDSGGRVTRLRTFQHRHEQDRDNQ